MEIWEFKKDHRLMVNEGPYAGTIGLFEKVYHHRIPDLAPSIYLRVDSGALMVMSASSVQEAPAHAHTLTAVPFPRTDAPLFWGTCCLDHPVEGRPVYYDPR